jgi:hypothetical protein
MHINHRTEISYRDPHGYVFEDNSKFYRFVDVSYQNQYEQLMRSGLYDELIQQNLITPFKEVNITDNSAYKILLPEQLDFLTYPYEWSFEQWKECAAVMLKINLCSIKYNMILKDATPVNFCLHKGKFIMFDILSFEFYIEGDPWVAYRQFCESFLAPISLMNYNHLQWGKLFRSSINGFELAFASKNLALKSYFNFSCLMHIHLHASIKNTALKNDGKKKAFLNKAQLIQLWVSLSNTIQSWSISGASNSLWLGYYEDDIQSDEYINLKIASINTWLAKIKPNTVIDMGANTGKFSVIASKYAEMVVAIEADPHSLNLLYNECKDLHNVYPVYADFSDPSPAMGWQNGEKKSLLSRLNSHTTMALAVIHHLRITYNIPLQFIAKLFHQITDKFLLVEFVAKSDVKVQTMLAHRNDIFDDYTTEHFIEIFEKLFTLVDERKLLGQERVLYLWERK